MMQARVNLITADPDRMADTIGYIKTSVRPAVESMDGSLGLSLYANAEIGVAVLESFWESHEALIHSEQMAAPRRTDVVHRAVGTVSVERYRVPVYEREAPLDTAVGLRLTRMDVGTAGARPRRPAAARRYPLLIRDWRKPAAAASLTWIVLPAGITSLVNHPVGGCSRPTRR